MSITSFASFCLQRLQILVCAILFHNLKYWFIEFVLSYVKSTQFCAGDRGAESWSGTGVQELLRTSRKPNKSRVVYRQLRSPHGFEHNEGIGPYAQEGRIDAQRAGDEYYGRSEPSRRWHRNVKRTLGSYEQLLDESKFLYCVIFR